MGRKLSDSDLAALRGAIASLRPEVPRTTLSEEVTARAVRTLCAWLAQRHPGRDIELRVPGYAAVQLGSGERGAHTRGTPPNVVETDALTLLRLAGGGLGWADAVADRRVRASGTRSDLSRLWPVGDLQAPSARGAGHDDRS